jgi:hypothetical protein
MLCPYDSPSKSAAVQGIRQQYLRKGGKRRSAPRILAPLSKGGRGDFSSPACFSASGAKKHKRCRVGLAALGRPSGLALNPTRPSLCESFPSGTPFPEGCSKRGIAGSGQMKLYRCFCFILHILSIL